MAETDLRRLLDYLLEETRQLGPRYLVDGKMTIPSSLIEGDAPRTRTTRYLN
jgi:hypothetical protein